MDGIAARRLAARVQGSYHTRSLSRRALALGGSMRTHKVHVEIFHVLPTSEKIIYSSHTCDRMLYTWDRDFGSSFINVLIIFGIH